MPPLQLWMPLCNHMGLEVNTALDYVTLYAQTLIRERGTGPGRHRAMCRDRTSPMTTTIIAFPGKRPHSTKRSALSQLLELLELSCGERLGSRTCFSVTKQKYKVCLLIQLQRSDVPRCPAPADSDPPQLNKSTFCSTKASSLLSRPLQNAFLQRCCVLRGSCCLYHSRYGAHCARTFRAAVRLE